MTRCNYNSWNLVEAVYHVSDDVSYVLRLRNESIDHGEHSSDNILFPQSGECNVYIPLNVAQRRSKFRMVHCLESKQT